MNLQSNDFEIFAVPQRFAQDLPQLEVRWKELQRQVHPDKFTTQGAAAQRVAMQWSARINEAYRRLRDPLKRAAYLCELNAVPVDAESNTAMPVDFLMQQMELREQLDDARTDSALDDLDQQANALSKELLGTIERQADVDADWRAVAQSARALMFLDKLGNDIARRRETLADQAS